MNSRRLKGSNMTDTVNQNISIDTEMATRVYNLVVELAATKTQKKASTTAFNEEIKRIEAEIKDLIDDPENVDTEE